LTPIAYLFNYTEYLSPYTSKNLTALQQNLITAGGQYCEWLEQQQSGTVAYCGQPTPDFDFGTSSVLTPDEAGQWGLWIQPENYNAQRWTFGFDGALTQVCLRELTGANACQTAPGTSVSSSSEVYVRDFINYVGIVSNGYAITDI